MINIFCFGFGQVAQNLIKKLDKEKIKINLSYTSRLPKDSNHIISSKMFNLNNYVYDTKILQALQKADFILVSIPPVNGEDIVIKNFLNNFKDLKPKWITYLSATSVYGDHNGEWVDEKSFTKPTSENGINRLTAEKEWISICTKLNLPIQIFRLSGIYSDTSNILKRLKLGNVKIIKRKNHFFSRIHVDDIANILLKSMKNFKSGEIYNISDDKPASSEEIIIYGAKLLNIKIPEQIELEEIENKMLINFYKDSKKVNNKKMKNFFNYELKYPSFKEGLNYIRDNFT